MQNDWRAADWGAAGRRWRAADWGAAGRRILQHQDETSCVHKYHQEVFSSRYNSDSTAELNITKKFPVIQPWRWNSINEPLPCDGSGHIYDILVFCTRSDFFFGLSMRTGRAGWVPQKGFIIQKGENATTMRSEELEEEELRMAELEEEELRMAELAQLREDIQ